MGLVGTVVRIVLVVPFVLGLYVLGAKPEFLNAVLTAYDTDGIPGIVGVVVGAPDVLGIVALAVVVAVLYRGRIDQ